MVLTSHQAYSKAQCGHCEPGGGWIHSPPVTTELTHHFSGLCFKVYEMHLIVHYKLHWDDSSVPHSH